MRKFILNIIIFSSLPLVFCIIILTTSLDRKQAWTSSPSDCDNRGTYIYQRIFTDTTPIDIAFLGTSHTINGIQDSLIERLLRKSDNPPLHVCNLGYCRFGNEMQYVIAQDLFSQKKPSFVVIEVNEELGLSSHPMFPYYAQTENIFQPASFTNQAVPSNTYNAFLARLTQFRSRLYAIPDSALHHSPVYGYGGWTESTDPSTLISPERNVSESARSFRELQTSYSREWISKLVILCHMNNARVLFVYIPSFHDQAKPIEGMEFYESLAPVLSINPDLIHEKNYWRDPDHFNDAGAKIFSEWLAEELLNN